MNGADRFQRILELTGSTTPPPPKLEIPQQDDTVTESEVEEVAEVCLTPKKVKEEENTAPSSNEKIDYSTTMPEIKLFTDESREQELKKRKAREFGEQLPLETLKAGGKKRTQEMRENIERMYQAAKQDGMLRRDRGILKAKAQRKEEELEALEEI